MSALRQRPPPVCWFHVENGLLFAATKTEWKIFDETIIWRRSFMTVGGRMSNDKPREVRRPAASESHRSRHTQAIAAQPNRDVVDRPRLLSDRFRLRNGHRKIENDDIVLETFTLPLEAARLEVRAIIDDISQRGYQKIVERWRQLPDGQIEFTMRRLPAAD